MITQKNTHDLSVLKTNNKSAFITTDLSKISEIYQEKINISIWQRKLDRSITKSSEHILNKNPYLEFSEVLQPGDVKKSLSSAMGLSKEMLPFFDDVFQMVSMFCKLFDQKKIWLRLDGIDHPMCPRFHTDKLKCRLVSTYLGPATQWLPHNLIDRSKLGYGNEGKPDSESGLFISEDSIQQCATGDVALLKGESWEGNDGAGLVHRSSYKEGSYKRLYMTIDFLETYINIYKNSLTN